MFLSIIYLSIYLSFYLPNIYLSSYLSFYFYIDIYLSIYVSIYLSSRPGLEGGGHTMTDEFPRPMSRLKSSVHICEEAEGAGPYVLYPPPLLSTLNPNSHSQPPTHAEPSRPCLEGTHLHRRVPETDVALEVFSPHFRRGGGRRAVGREVDESLGGVGLTEGDGWACVGSGFGVREQGFGFWVWGLGGRGCGLGI